ncbi:MAG: transglutaminaseTgpA domain-containing protein, partial [Micrococcales bacterium]|nr:transglutaminaseTgpA domain-containing protein [Micrococcales bacterium]
MSAPTRSRAANRARRRYGPDVVVLLAGLGLAVTPLLPVYGGIDAVPALAVGLVAGTLLAVVATKVRWPAWLVTAVGAALVVLVGTPLTGASTIAGVVPTPRGAGQVAAACFTTWKDVLTLDPPLGATGDVLLAPFLLTFLGSLLAVTLALRASATVGALGAVVVVVALVVSVTLGTSTQPVSPLITGTVLVAGLLGWTAVRTGSGVRRRPVASMSLLALVVIGAVVAGPVLAGQPRYVVRDHVVPPFDPRPLGSPLSGFRQYVKADEEVLFTVKGLPSGARVRLAVMDRYDGMLWNVAGGHAAQGSGEFRRVGSAVHTPDDGVKAEVTFNIKNLSGVWLPTVGSATSFDMDSSVARNLRYNDATGGAVLTSGLRENMTYSQQVVIANLGVHDSDIGSARSANVVLPADTGVSPT